MEQVTIQRSEDAKPRISALTRSRTRLTLVLIIAAGFLDVIDFSIVQVALPTIRTELMISLAESQWIIGAYGLTLAGFLLLSGRAGDIYGHCLRDPRNNLPRGKRKKPRTRHFRRSTVSRLRCRVHLRRGPHSSVRLEVRPIRQRPNRHSRSCSLPEISGKPPGTSNGQAPRSTRRSDSNERTRLACVRADKRCDRWFLVSSDYSAPRTLCPATRRLSSNRAPFPVAANAPLLPPTRHGPYRKRSSPVTDSDCWRSSLHSDDLPSTSIRLLCPRCRPRIRPRGNDLLLRRRLVLIATRKPFRAETRPDNFDDSHHVGLRPAHPDYRH